jgi:hypothetical protein
MCSLFQGRTAPRSPRRRWRAVPVLERLDERTLPSVTAFVAPPDADPTALSGPAFSPAPVYHPHAHRPAEALLDPAAPAQPTATDPPVDAPQVESPSPPLAAFALPEQPDPPAAPLAPSEESTTPTPTAQSAAQAEQPAGEAEQAVAATASVASQVTAASATTAAMANAVSQPSDGEHRGSPAVVPVHSSGRPSNPSESPTTTPDLSPTVGGKGEVARTESPSHVPHEQTPLQSPSRQRRPAGAGTGADEGAEVKEARELFLSDDGEALPATAGDLPPATTITTPTPGQGTRPDARSLREGGEPSFIVGLDVVAPGGRAVEFAAQPVPVAEDVPASPAPAGVGFETAAWRGFDGLTATPTAGEGGAIGTFELLGGIALALVLRPVERARREAPRLGVD